MNPELLNLNHPFTVDLPEGRVGRRGPARARPAAIHLNLKPIHRNSLRSSRQPPGGRVILLSMGSLETMYVSIEVHTDVSYVDIPSSLIARQTMEHIRVRGGLHGGGGPCERGRHGGHAGHHVRHGQTGRHRRGRACHSSTFRLHLSTFCGVRCVVSVTKKAKANPI